MFFLLVWLAVIFISPVFALDFDSVEQNVARKTYVVNKSQTGSSTNSSTIKNTTIPSSSNTATVLEKQIVQTSVPAQNIQNYEKLPTVPKLPEKTFNSSVAPINTMYAGKVPDANAYIPCNDIKVEDLILDKRYIKTKYAEGGSKQKIVENKSKETTKITNKSNYRYRLLSKGVQFRVVNTTKINDYMCEGQRIIFKSTHSMHTTYFNVPANTKFVGIIESAHKPQMACNGGLVGLRITSAEMNGYNQNINAVIVKIKNDNVRFSNLKGEHTYIKTTCKKAKWGQKKYSQYSKTSSKLASKGAGVIIAPFPYISGCVLACASTITSPITALFSKGRHLSLAPNTVFTIKLKEDAKIRY